MASHEPRAMETIATIDQGTQSTRVHLYDKQARPIASYHAEFKQHRERAGYAHSVGVLPHPAVTLIYCLAACSWIEQDPEEIWQGVQECFERAVQAAQKQHGSVTVKALGITNQRETTLVWDKATGKPLHRAIVWMDSRTAPLCESMEQELGSKVRARTHAHSYVLESSWLLMHVTSIQLSFTISIHHLHPSSSFTCLLERVCHCTKCIQKLQCHSRAG